MNYRKHHDAIINRAKIRILHGYAEKHHIVPRCMGGGDDLDNLVNLTAEEHFVIHQLLVKIYSDQVGLVFALCAMRMNGQTKNKSNNKQFGWLRRKMAAAIRQIKTGVPRPPHIGEIIRKRNLGSKASAETKAKQSLALSGKPKSSEHIEKMRSRMISTVGVRTGHTNSSEHRAKQSAAAIGRKMSPESVLRSIASRTPEQRRQAALKAWATKRAQISDV